jgi:hypothetical protein
MERQLSLNLGTEEERVASVRTYLQPVELAPRQVAAVALIVGCGEAIQVLGQPARRWCADKATISEKAKKYGLNCSGNTFLRAVEELEFRRIVGVLRNTRPWTYAVSLAALAKVEMRRNDPIAALESLPCFGGLEGGDRGESRSPSVTLGQGARDRERIHTQNPCPTVYRASVDVTSGGGLADRMQRPWDRAAGLCDEDLVRAVVEGDLDPIRRLWEEAKVLEWVGCNRAVSDDETLRFLAIVHHCATSPGINQSRMGVLVNRVKRGLDATKTRQASDQWAAAVMARRHKHAEAAAR